MYKKNPTTLLSFYLVISIIILNFNLNPTIKAVRDFLFYMIISPYSKANFTISSVSNLGVNIRELIDVHKQVLELKNKNQELLHDLVRLKTLEIENGRMSELLKYKRKTPIKTTIARIIATPPQQYYKTIIIDKGLDDGLSENRAVYGFYKERFGIVGQLITVEKEYSQVLVITNRISKIPARVLSTNVDGIIVGRETNELEMMWIPTDADIKIGDEVVSSPASEIFPAGVSIGRIVSISESGHLLFKSAKVIPTIPTFQLTDVFIE
ncbi:MAG: rod shape-determining protein MreC [Elusimicrobia bacterium]|nr:rod shape-determining protein MreC [Elusimicrobiota bacterium]